MAITVKTPIEYAGIKTRVTSKGTTMATILGFPMSEDGTTDPEQMKVICFNEDVIKQLVNLSKGTAILLALEVKDAVASEVCVLEDGI